MKRTERQHLKEHELEALARQAREMVGARRRETTLIVTVLVIVGAILGGYLLWRERVSSKAHDLLAQAVAVHDARVGPPPAPGQPAGGLYFPTERERAQAALTKSKVAADAYPSTDGIRRRLGRTYLDAGKRPDAQQTVNRLVQEYPESPFNGDAKKELENLKKTT